MSNIEKSFQLKKELDSLRPLKKEDELRIMQKFRLDWNFHSNNLEGNSLTFGDTKALIFFGITAQGKPLQHHIEVTGHDEAIQWVMDIVKDDRPLTETFIRELHELILKEPYEVDAITPDGKPTKKKIRIGKYKNTPNHVRTKSGEIFRFATVEETPAKMTELIDWYSSKKQDKDVNPIFLAAVFHYRFIRIHPFDDGNGRTARILMNLILMQHNYPPAIIKTSDKENYFSALAQADAGTEFIEVFVEYIAKCVNHSLQIMIKGAKGESIEDPDDLDKKIVLLEQKLKTIGNKIDVFKSKESLLSIYDDSISRLVSKFIEKNEKFDKFYNKINVSIFINEEAGHHSKNDLINFNRRNINSSTESLLISYEFKLFKHEGFEKFTFDSRIKIRFNDQHYILETNPIIERSDAQKSKKNTGSVYLKKLYNTQLTNDEIAEIVSDETERHWKAIEMKIADFN